MRKGSFSILLLVAALSLTGLALTPMLKIQLEPDRPQHSISVGVSLSGASPRTLESEVTSKVEAALAGISSVTDISSVSNDGSGYVTLSFTGDTDMQVARFEVASRIRNLWPSLPEGAGYPTISLSSSGKTEKVAMSYLLKGALPSRELATYAEKYLTPSLSTLKGLERVEIAGVPPYHWVVEYDAAAMRELSLSPGDISEAFSNYYFDGVVGIVDDGSGPVDVRLKSCRPDDDFSHIPVARREGRTVFLGDIATWRYEQGIPSGYFRMNGLNTVTLSCYVSDGTNLLRVTDAIKKNMDILSHMLPEQMSVSLAHDSSEYIRSELFKILIRTVLCLLLLLFFILLVTRSWKYLVIVSLSLGADILVSVTVYAILGIPVHIYTLAGITVSLGIVIDVSIVMIDHWIHRADRRVFVALIGAVLTTVASLSVIFLLPEKERISLSDFASAICINLSVSLILAWFFVPALFDCFGSTVSDGTRKSSRLRRAVRWNKLYLRYISWATGHKWILVVVLVVSFGIPTHLLPSPRQMEKKNKWYDKPVRALVTWKPYAQNRSRIDAVLGSSFGFFHRAMRGSDFYRQHQEKVLSIRAAMPEGCSVVQLNEVVRAMENYLAGFEEIDHFVTRVYSYDNASVDVYFKPGVANTTFPSELKSEVISLAISYGGATWSVSGIDDRYFNNDVVTTRPSNTIILMGYNYDDLCRYADILVNRLSENRRVANLQIWSNDNRAAPETQWQLDYDFEKISVFGASPYRFYAALRSPLYKGRIATVPDGDGYCGVDLVSSEAENFDMWHAVNSAVSIGDTRVKLSDIGGMQKRKSGIPVRRRNQSFFLSVKYDFIGNWELSNAFTKEMLSYMNNDVLPMGYTAGRPATGWFGDKDANYVWVIMLVMAVIFALCSITFESLRLPLAVIITIPISFIGSFLTFGLSGLTFDQGGFAAFIMLCGITVNAGIYLIMAFKDWLYVSIDPAKAYLRAFDSKIWPISLTILSTVLGLLPFLSDGPQEVFWFDFAIGTISGLIFSIIAILLYLPVFSLPNVKDNISKM